jgi:hypothetical protein
MYGRLMKAQGPTNLDQSKIMPNNTKNVGNSAKPGSTNSSKS